MVDFMLKKKFSVFGTYSKKKPNIYLRFINNKSPFEGDNNHLHHLLIKKFNYKNSMIIIFMLIFTPIILYNFFEINPLILIILSFIIYLTILLICLKKNITMH